MEPANPAKCQGLLYRKENIREPCSAVVSSSQTGRKPKFFDFVQFQNGGGKSQKQSAEQSVVQLIKSTHQINHNKIRKGKTILNKHTKSITRQSSMTVNFNRGNSSKQMKQMPQAVQEVQSPASSCNSSPTKLQNTNDDQEQIVLLSQPLPIRNLNAAESI